MEADWSVEIGAGLASIDIPWRGDDCEAGRTCEFVDLVAAPDLSSSIGEIVEARDEPSLFRALLRLNGVGSPVSTSKCDVWLLDEDEIDPDEFDADFLATAGRASYIDFVFRDASRFTSFEWQEKWLRRVTDYLRNLTLPAVRVDLVLRRAVVRGMEGFGITVYAMGCGVEAYSSSVAWGAALEISVDAICGSQFLADEE